MNTKPTVEPIQPAPVSSEAEEIASQISEIYREFYKGKVANHEACVLALLSTALHAARLEERNAVIQKLLDNAHGGGNWRRIAEQLRSPQTIAKENNNGL